MEGMGKREATSWCCGEPLRCRRYRIELIGRRRAAAASELIKASLLLGPRPLGSKSEETFTWCSQFLLRPDTRYWFSCGIYMGRSSTVYLFLCKRSKVGQNATSIATQGVLGHWLYFPHWAKARFIATPLVMFKDFKVDRGATCGDPAADEVFGGDEGDAAKGPSSITRARQSQPTLSAEAWHRWRRWPKLVLLPQGRRRGGASASPEDAMPGIEHGRLRLTRPPPSGNWPPPLPART